MVITPTVGRPVTVDADQILDAASELIMQDGIKHVTLVAVADCAGVSRRTVYRYFSDRTGLIDAVIGRERERFVEAALEAGHGEDDLATALERMVSVVLEMAQVHALFACLRRTDPDVLYPLLLSTSGIVIEEVIPITSAFIAGHQGGKQTTLSAGAVEIFSRVLVSYVADPPAGPIGEVASSLAAVLVTLLSRAEQTEGGTR